MKVSDRQLFFDPKTFLYKIRYGSTRTRFRRQQIVYSIGDTSDSIFYILDGTVTLSSSKISQEHIIAPYISIGDFFGQGCLLGELHRMSNAFAASECSIVRIEKSAMLTMLRAEPVFAARFISLLLNRNLRMEEALIDQSFSPGEKRLAKLLLLLSSFGKEGKPIPVIANLSQEGMARVLGTTRWRIISTMNKFRELGLIEYENSLRVHSSLLNVILCD
jgi:CRP/FNR family transcriptional regulator, cyclic AMP receptor protein